MDRNHRIITNDRPTCFGLILARRTKDGLSEAELWVTERAIGRSFFRDSACAGPREIIDPVFQGEPRCRVCCKKASYHHRIIIIIIIIIDDHQPRGEGRIKLSDAK